MKQLFLSLTLTVIAFASNPAHADLVADSRARAMEYLQPEAGETVYEIFYLYTYGASSCQDHHFTYFKVNATALSGEIETAPAISTLHCVRGENEILLSYPEDLDPAHVKWNAQKMSATVERNVMASWNHDLSDPKGYAYTLAAWTRLPRTLKITVISE